MGGINMTREHWLFLLATALLLGLMLAFTLNHRPQSKAYRWAQRLFWSLVFLQGCSMAGWLGVNAVNLLVTAALGIPGGCALLVISLM